MTRTPEQVTADNQLEAAIRNALEAYGILDEGQFVTTWITVVNITSASLDDGEKSAYATLAPGGHIPAHIAVGLLHCGEDSIFNPSYEDED